MLKREVQKAENESNRNIAIITDYKQVKCQRMLSKIMNTNSLGKLSENKNKTF
jgi:hypothetical protein